MPRRRRNFALVREALGLDLERAAVRIGCSPEHLRRLENCRAPLNDLTIERMIAAYGVSESVLTRPAEDRTATA